MENKKDIVASVYVGEKVVKHPIIENLQGVRTVFRCEGCEQEHFLEHYEDEVYESFVESLKKGFPNRNVLCNNCNEHIFKQDNQETVAENQEVNDENLKLIFNNVVNEMNNLTTYYFSNPNNEEKIFDIKPNTKFKNITGLVLVGTTNEHLKTIKIKGINEEDERNVYPRLDPVQQVPSVCLVPLNIETSSYLSIEFTLKSEGSLHIYAIYN